MTDIRCQTEAMIGLDDIVDKKHPYRACDRMVDFRIPAKPMHARRSDQGRREIGAERGLRMLILRFVEDRSDREMERFMKDTWPPAGSAGSPSTRERPTAPVSGRSASASGPRG